MHLLTSLIDRFFKGRASALQNIPSYVFVDRVINESEVLTGIRVTSGIAEGMIFTWNPEVRFKNKDDGNIDMNFDYYIHVPPKNDKILDSHQELTNIVGDIIFDVIKRDFDKTDANRNVDFKCTE